jgi:simple sugar transport system permease protein
MLLFFHLVVAHTPFGRALYAIGGNEEAARLSGIPVQRVKTLAYVICGFLAALAGICHAAQDTYGNPDAGMMYELSAIAAVVIGGTSLMGGRGGMLLTLVGVMIIGYIENILRINNVAYHIRLVAQGAIIVAAVLVQQRRRD